MPSWLSQLVGVGMVEAGLLLASSGQRPGMLLGILQCTQHGLSFPNKELSSLKCQYSWPSVSADAEPTDTEGQLYLCHFI